MTAKFDPDQMTIGYTRSPKKIWCLPMTAASSSLQSCTGSAKSECKHGRSDNGCEDCKVRLFSVCGALEPSELDDLDRISQARHFPTRTMLFEQGALAGSVFNVTE